MKQKISNPKSEDTMKKKFKINLWDYLNIEEINNALDETMKKGIPADIHYKCLKVSKHGTLEIEASFKLENC